VGEEAGTYTAPRTPAETAMAQIWAEVFRLERIGIHDDFFELGGHSLLAGQTVARIRRALGVELPLSALFDAPTIAGLCETLGLVEGMPSGSQA
jgi:acyl carrier protein